MKIGFIGLGNMASAMIAGIVKQGKIKKEQIIGADTFLSAAIKAEETFGIQISNSNVEVVKQADLIILSIKPQYYETVIQEIREEITADKMICTIAPGKTITWLSEQFIRPVKLIRCMPNTPALVGEGCTGVCHNELVTNEETEQILELLKSFGMAQEVPEYLLDAVVGVSGSSPAYVFLFIEAMADGAVAAGMPRSQAYQFAAQAVLGSAKMVLETGKHPGELKDMVCSPGGTTIQAVKKLEEKGFRSAVMEAMEVCIEKSKNM